MLQLNIFISTIWILVVCGWMNALVVQLLRVRERWSNNNYYVISQTIIWLWKWHMPIFPHYHNTHATVTMIPMPVLAVMKIKVIRTANPSWHEVALHWNQLGKRWYTFSERNEEWHELLWTCPWREKYNIKFVSYSEHVHMTLTCGYQPITVVITIVVCDCCGISKHLYTCHADASMLQASVRNTISTNMHV